jgi:hypothetical protein
VSLKTIFKQSLLSLRNVNEEEAEDEEYERVG